MHRGHGSQVIWWILGHLQGNLRPLVAQPVVHVHQTPCTDSSALNLRISTTGYWTPAGTQGVNGREYGVAKERPSEGNNEMTRKRGQTARARPRTGRAGAWDRRLAPRQDSESKAQGLRYPLGRIKWTRSRLLE